MNDFTKDELTDILSCINEAYRSCCINPRISFELRNKIQHLIENYCEHDNTKFVNDVGIDKCKKCGVIVDD